MTAIDANQVTERVQSMRDRIHAAGGQHVRLVAVTKGFGADAVQAALRSGVSDLGENYAQEMLGKVAVLDPADSERSCWHFLGRVQRNKVRSLARHVGVWQSVDRLELATEIARRAPKASVLVQVNLSGEPQKGGCHWGDLPDLVDRLRTLDLDLQGLMGVGPQDDPVATRVAFARLVAAADALELPERSIGMTDDWEIAVGEGSTMVRIGRELFGPR